MNYKKIVLKLKNNKNMLPTKKTKRCCKIDMNSICTEFFSTADVNERKKNHFHLLGNMLML